MSASIIIFIATFSLFFWLMMSLANETEVSDEVMFTKGDCYVLALEINRITNWPIVDINKHHACVKTPCGNYLDVNGSYSFEEISKIWGSEDFYEFNPKDEDYYFQEWGPHFDNSKERAEILAPQLIKSVT